jgi:hypothetical protein
MITGGADTPTQRIPCPSFPSIRRELNAPIGYGSGVRIGLQPGGPRRAKLSLADCSWSPFSDSSWTQKTFQAYFVGKSLRNLVDLVRFELTTSSMPWKPMGAIEGSPP